MKIVLIYNVGDEYDGYTDIKEFECVEKVLKFINENNIGESVMGAYQFYQKIEFEPFEKVVNYRIKKNK